MMNFYFANFVKIVLALILAVLQAGARPAAAHISMLNRGDLVNGMTLTTGAAEARPLWTFCSSEVNKNVTTASCRVPQTSRIAIGHVFLGTPEALSKAKWSELEWELYLDDKLVDLDQFGTYNYIVPSMAPNPSLVYEVFMKSTAWDVVLTNLQPGEYTLDGRVRTDAEEYRWTVNLVIESRRASRFAKV